MCVPSSFLMAAAPTGAAVRCHCPAGSPPSTYAAPADRTRSAARSRKEWCTTFAGLLVAHAAALPLRKFLGKARGRRSVDTSLLHQTQRSWVGMHCPIRIEEPHALPCIISRIMSNSLLAGVVKPNSGVMVEAEVRVGIVLVVPAAQQPCKVDQLCVVYPLP